MLTDDPPRVVIHAIGHATAATIAFRVAGQLRVAAIVKATFVIAQDRPMLRVEPDPIATADEHQGGDAAKSVITASDLAPYKPAADVLLRGHARAPIAGPTPRVALRLMMARGSSLVLDKRLVAQGPIDPARGEPAPFSQIPLSYELARGGAENPVGAREPQAPSLVDAWHRPLPVGFGPIGHRWPARRALVRDASSVDAIVPDLPSDFAWSFYNAAPPDQRVAHLRGDEWVGFEGMNSQIPRLQSCLPSARGVAAVYGPGPDMARGRAIDLVADTLSIDADRLRVSVVWRGSFVAPEGVPLDALVVFAGVSTSGEPVTLPATYEPSLASVIELAPRAAKGPPSKSAVRARLAPINADEPRAGDALSGTRIVNDAIPSSPALPFEAPKIAEKSLASITLDIPADFDAPAPMPFEGAPRLPPREEPLPIATPFDRGARAVPQPPEEPASAELETLEIAHDLRPIDAPPAFTQGVAQPPLLGEIEAVVEPPKTLGQAFLHAMTRAGAKAPRDPLARGGAIFDDHLGGRQ